MVNIYYEVTFFLSLFLMLIYFMRNHKNSNVTLTLLFCFIPVTNLGYVMLSKSESLEAALMANKVIYIGGCYLELLITLSIFSLCHIELKRIYKVMLIFISSVIYLCAFYSKESHFYTSVGFSTDHGTSRLIKVYGYTHSLFYVMILMYLVLSVTAMLYSYFKKEDISNKIIYLLMMPVCISLASYLSGKIIPSYIDTLPATYVAAQIVYLIIIDRMFLYNTSDTCIESLVQNGETGFVSFDFFYNYLGSNETAKNFLPFLRGLPVDKPITNNPLMQDNLCKWLETFCSDNEFDKVSFHSGDRILLIEIKFLHDGRRRRGYQLFITDDTHNQKYIELINTYNSDLIAEVSKKTAHIEEMHNKLILGMATMVESRDNSTGGHIRRTSEIVRMLIEEIQNSETMKLPESFCRNIIKAAPMHDLGKIAVDDAVLRKPGRFTDEEYEKMKVHAAEGARIVHSVLDGTDDEEFHIIAENVAHYHHERWDGSGYPVGLSGTNIPLEARIMAIADVYDALVSKRVYKESMSFSEADSIIMNGMGRHFDPSLEQFYVSARPKLEMYYSSLDVVYS